MEILSSLLLHLLTMPPISSFKKLGSVYVLSSAYVHVLLSRNKDGKKWPAKALFRSELFACRIQNNTA